MRTFFTGDEHHGHELLREMRGFPNANAMSDVLIANHNALVGKEDRTIHLGDFSYRMDDERKLHRLFERMNGSHFLLVGNHDGPQTLALPWSGRPRETWAISVDGQRLWLAHYAHRTWPGYHKGAVHLYGHSHGRIPADDRSCDVGVDAWGLMPVTIAQIQARLAVAPPHQDPETEPSMGGLTL